MWDHGSRLWVGIELGSGTVYGVLEAGFGLLFPLRDIGHTVLLYPRLLIGMYVG